MELIPNPKVREEGFKKGREYYQQNKPYKYAQYEEKKYNSPDDRLEFMNGFVEGWEFEESSDCKINPYSDDLFS